MGKRSSFERLPRDFYPTPAGAVFPLLPHLRPHTRFAEPCAGNGALIRALEAHGHKCGFACDIEPQADGIEKFDATNLDRFKLGLSWECLITNPPWSRPNLHQLIEHLAKLGPTWLLFDADWMHTRQAVPYLHRLRKIVSVGRLKWIPDSPHSGKDNCCWYLFDATGAARPAPAEFVGRAA